MAPVAGSFPSSNKARAVVYAVGALLLLIIVLIALAASRQAGVGTAFFILSLVVACFVSAYRASRHALLAAGEAGQQRRALAAYAEQQEVAHWEHQAQERARVEHERRLLLRADNLGSMLVQTPTEFEETAALLLRYAGYRLARVGGAGDLGADLLGSDANGRSVVAQCKRYAPGNKVGTPALQSFIGMQVAHHRTAIGLFVTTSSFTAPARALAQQHGIVLFDGEQLVELALRTHSQPSRGRHAR